MKTAQDDYAQRAGYGDTNYNPGIDDPTQLAPQFYNPPQWDPYAWPKWALPTGLIATGLLGAYGLSRLGRLMGRRGAPAAAAAAVPKLGSSPSPPVHFVLGLGQLAKGR